jgi:8-amino-7-oxononanoate synthase
MSQSIQQYIQSKLQQRKDENNFRSLRVTKGLVDFYSNDYLGFARDEALKDSIQQEIAHYPEAMLGSTGSRLLSGNNEYFDSLEKLLTEFHCSEAALIFNSGFDANYGLLSTLPYRGDTIIYDELIHASLHDGIRNSKAYSASFAHNSLNGLHEKLESAKGLKYVVVESVYSMDGDLAPLKAIADLCEEYDAGLIVDEAHATGTQGKQGEGRVSELGINTTARIHTFSKALGAFGAVILCSNELKQFLINYCRPFIYSTALPFHSLAAVKASYDCLNRSDDKRKHLAGLIDLFKRQIKLRNGLRLITSDTPIQSLIISGNQNVKDYAERIQQEGLDVRPILHPTVAKGNERIRICLHSFNTEEELSRLTQAINDL